MATLRARGRTKKMAQCRKCRRRSVAGGALLPGAWAVVCRDCFKKLTGRHALPSAGPLGLLTFHLGQSVSESARKALGLPDMVPPPGATMPADMDALLEQWDEQLQAVGDDARLAGVDMQNVLQKQQQTLQILAQISRMLPGSAMAVIRNIGG